MAGEAMKKNSKKKYEYVSFLTRQRPLIDTRNNTNTCQRIPQYPPPDKMNLLSKQICKLADGEISALLFFTSLLPVIIPQLA